MTATLEWMGCATFRLTLDNQVSHTRCVIFSHHDDWLPGFSR